MNALDYATLATQIGDTYQKTAEKLTIFIHDQEGKEDNHILDQLYDQQEKLCDQANQFYDLSDKIAFENSENYFLQIEKVTVYIRSTVDEINQVNRWVNLIAGMLSLAEGIVGHDGGQIGTALQQIQDATTGWEKK